MNALNSIPLVGPKSLRTLSDFFGEGKKIWNAAEKDLIATGIGERAAASIVNSRSTINPDKKWEELQKENIQVISARDKNFPAALNEISNPPFLLYIKGDIDFNSAPAVAVVGSRKLTDYVKQAAYCLAKDLAQAGIIVVSGMALGVDAAAHRGALDGEGKTIAVLGSGLDDGSIGPRANFQLSRQIILSGALISENAPRSPVIPGSFPARNRIMAGMSLGVVVVEAAPESGSLITASLALDFNREVFAVPGSIFSESSLGTNNLIRSGAKLITGVKDILEELNIEKKKSEKNIKKIIPSGPEEELILKKLSSEPMHIDRIVRATKLKTNIASSILSLMEMKGMAKDIGGQNYIVLR